MYIINFTNFYMSILAKILNFTMDILRIIKVFPIGDTYKIPDKMPEESICCDINRLIMKIEKNK